MEVSVALLCAFSALLVSGIHGAAFRPSCMFVFGDSYADTGNHPKNDSTWKLPYGETWPGLPSGRFGNGKILTDFLAELLGMESPLPYRVFKESNEEGCNSSSGMNFAYGGSGVFYTFGPQFTNLSRQVEEMKGVLMKNSSCFGEDVIQKSVVVFTNAGNDYIKYVGAHGQTLGVLTFVPEVTRGIASSLESLYDLGFRYFLVANMQPAGCLPSFTRVNGFKGCNGTGNLLSTTHNEHLLQSLANLQNRSGAHVDVLDHFSIFQTILSNATDYGINEPFEPCCLANVNHTCGDMDKDGKPLYKLCQDPSSNFFWDNSHPSQAGWDLVTRHYTNLAFPMVTTATMTDVNGSSSSALSMAPKLPQCISGICVIVLAFWLAVLCFLRF